MPRLIKLTRYTGASDSINCLLSIYWPPVTTPCYIPTNCIGPMTPLQVPCRPWHQEPVEGMPATTNITEVMWGLLGTAGSVNVVETPEEIAKLMCAEKHLVRLKRRTKKLGNL